MGQRGVSVGTRMDGTVDIDIHQDEDSEDATWNTNNLELREAEFLHEELGRAIARQKERGFPKPPPPPDASQLPPPFAAD